MSITVLPRNNNDNWVANAVVNFVGPLIGDWIKSEREKEINRKHNAAIYEASRILGLDGNDFSNLPPSMNNNNGNGGLLGGSNNAWENAFRNMDNSPLADFDNNTAGIAPNLNTNIAASPNQRQQRIPTPAEFLQAMANVVGSDPKRFGLVNLENLQKLSAPILAAYESSRNEQRRKEIGENLRNSANSPERLANIWNAVAQGILPIEAVAQARSETQPYSIDTGGNINRGIFDFASGKYIDQDALPKSLTPQDVANNLFRNEQLQTQDNQFIAGLKYQEEQNEANRNLQRYIHDSTLEFNKESTKWQQEFNEVKFKSDEEFRKWQIEKQEEIAHSGQQFSPQNQALREQLNKDLERLITEEKSLQDDMKESDNAEANANRLKRIQEINAEKQAIRTAIYSTFAPPTSSQSNSYEIPKTSLGSQLIGNANAGRITGKFGEDRKDHTHKGTDYPAREGEPITMREFWGDTLTVKRVNTNPNASTYGNFVELEGIVGGKKVSFLMAHMKTGSVKVKAGDTVKAGDFIGEVGNTGRSHGSHLHLEVRVDGQLIDPEKYFSTMQPHVAKYSQNNNNSNNTKLTPFVRDENNNTGNNNTNNSTSQQQNNQNSQNQQQNTQNQNDNTPILWKHSNGKTLTSAQYETFVKNAEAGKIEGIKTREDADKFLQNEGYSRENTPVNSNDNDPIVMRNYDTGEVIRQSKINEFIKNGRTEKDIYNLFKAIGFKRIRPHVNPDNDPIVMRNPETGDVLRQSKLNEHLEDDNWSKDYTYQIYRSFGYQPVLSNSNNENVGLTHRLTDEEKERAATQGSTGNDIARVPEKQNEAILNGEKSQNNKYAGDEYNSEVMWTHPNGSTITKSEYNNRIKVSGMENPDYDAWLESQGYRRADNSNSPAPVGTDYVNGTTNQAMRRQVDYLNGNNTRHHEETGTTFMGEDLPGLQMPGALAASDTPMGRNGGANVNAPSPQDYINYEEFLPPVGQKERYNSRVLPPVGQTYPQNVPTQEKKNNLPQQTQQPKQTTRTPKNNQPTRRNGVIYPKREARSPGKFKTNTSYENLKPIVDNAAKKHSVDTALVRAIIQVESQWDSNARSAFGAKGLMQLMPGTARGLGVRDAYDVTQNIEGGTKYIAQLIRQFNGDINKALMAYNWGPTYVKKGKNPPARVQNYANKVMAIYNRLKGNSPITLSHI